MDTVTKPRGRRPGHADTRAAILRSALELFSEFGYDKVSLRAVARAADVDPALIHHYFESKADLFSRSVLDVEINAERALQEILDGPVEHLGERAAASFLATWQAPGARERFIAMFRAAVNDDGPRRVLVEFLSREIFVKVVQRLGLPDPATRASLAVAALLGIVMARDILAMPSLTSLKDAEVIAGLGRVLQQHLVEP